MLINVCRTVHTVLLPGAAQKESLPWSVWAGQGSVKRKCMARVLQKARVWLGKERLRKSPQKGGTAHADARCAEVGLCGGRMGTEGESLSKNQRDIWSLILIYASLWVPYS